MAMEGSDAAIDPRLLLGALDAAPDPVFVKDARHRWLWGNAAWMRLMGGVDTIGLDDSAFFPPEQVAVFWASDDRVLATGLPQTQEEQIGDGLWALVKKWPVTLPDGAPGLAGLICDVTDYRRRALEVEGLRAAEAARSDFLATVGHELRTPLNGVLGVAALLRAGTAAPEQQALCDVILRSGRHLLELVGDMLDAGRLEAGRLTLAEAPFDPAAAVADPVALLRPLAEAKGLTLELTLDPGLPARALGDDGRLRQVVGNLVGNAVKFTPRGGVCVRAWTEGARLTIEVSDDGPGVPEDRRAAIFDRFVQAEEGVSRRHGGAGLGLAICRDLVALMGGAITLAPGPDAAGQGAAAGMGPSGQGGAPTPVAPTPVAPTPGAPTPVAPTPGAAAGQGAAAASGVRADASAAAGPEAGPDGRPEAAVAPAGPAGRGARAPAPDHGPGQGATFRVELPLRPAPGDAAAADLPPPAPRADGGVDVLVFEDNPVSLMVVEGMLRAEGYAVAAAAPEAAAAMRVATAPRLILMDLSMPGLDGCEAARRIRAVEAAEGLPRAPLIGLTAQAGPEARARCLAAGMDAHLPKPLDPAALRTALAAWMAPLR